MTIFKEMTQQRKNSKGIWAKIYHAKSVRYATPDTFEQLLKSVGTLLDETQLERVADWSSVRIDVIQYNDRIIDVTIKCAAE